MQVASVDSLRRRLDAVATGRQNSVVDRMLARGMPVHLGGMSDPFGPDQTKATVALGLLSALAEHQHPTVISTKSVLLAGDAYVDVLKAGRFAVQFSFSTLDVSLSRQIEIGVPSPEARLAAMRKLTDAGVPVSARMQPLLPGREDEASALIAAASQSGARHVGVEHLKLPVERRGNGITQLSRRLGEDLRASYLQQGARRIGREFVLPVEQRLPTILHLRQAAHDFGLGFGAADTDLLLLSDGGCCCSGADDLGLGTFHRFTYVDAVRMSHPDEIRFDALRNVWRPDGTISRFVNSNSRLPANRGRGAGMGEYLRHNWNGRANGPSPQMLWGVEPTGRYDGHDLMIYRVADRARALLDARRCANRAV
jgi:hypothetical protein